MSFVFPICNGENSGWADLDGRADCIRDGNSITLHRVIVPSVERGRKIFLARFDRCVLTPQINEFSWRAPVAQLDGACGYGFKKAGLRGFSLCCTPARISCGRVVFVTRNTFV